MKLISIFVISALASVVLAAPTALIKAPFAETCKNIALRGEYWITADCQSGVGDEVITSAIFIARWIEEPDEQIPDQEFNVCEPSSLLNFN